jgi:hypothetical protein
LRNGYANARQEVEEKSQKNVQRAFAQRVYLLATNYSHGKGGRTKQKASKDEQCFKSI